MQPPSAVVAFVVREVEVPEDIGRLSVCIQLISAFPLTQDAKVAISSNDGSAVSTPIPPGMILMTGILCVTVVACTLESMLWYIGMV